MKNSDINFPFNSLLITLTLVFWLSISYGHAQPKTVHLINIFDFQTEIVDPITGELKSYKISVGAEKFRSYITAKAYKIAETLKIPLKSHDFFDADFIPDPLHSKFSKYAIQDSLYKLSCKGDIVIVAVLCHGFSSNTEKYSNDSVNYPNLILNYSGNISESIPFGDILCSLTKKQPSLILSIVSTCQELVSDVIASMIQKRYEGFLRNFNNFSIAGKNDQVPYTNSFEVRIERINDLFNQENLKTYVNDSSQTICIELISCDKGEYTYIDEEGGHFLSAFMDVFDESLNSPLKVDWLSIAEKTKLKTQNTINDYNTYLQNKRSEDYHLQNPQCFVTAKSGSCSDMPYFITSTLTNQQFGENSADFYIYQDHLSKNIETPYYIAVRFVKLGDSYREAGNPELAIRTLDVAIEMLQQTENQYVLATAYEKKGLALRDKLETDAAINELRKARNIFSSLNCQGSVSAIDHILVSLKN